MADAPTHRANIQDLRRNYMRRGLDESELAPDPFRQFGLWFDEASASGELVEPNAMVLSTVSQDGQPHGRFVLLKGFDENGFVFFTNYRSAKGQELASDSRAALTFGWLELERQVRIEGRATQTTRSAVEAYFRTRPRGSKLGAWASDQSVVVADRAELERKLAEAEARFADEVPPPEEWGGYLLKPEQVEFWQGRTNRLHDRLRYRQSDRGWIVERLAP